MRLFTALVGLLFALLPGVRAEDTFRNGDQLEMRLSGPPEEFTREFNLVLTINEDSVNIPLIGRIRAAGLSGTQLGQIIEKRLKDEKIFTVANVNINVNSNQNQRTIIIGGAVRAPGRQPWFSDLTLTGAVTAAGPSEWATDGIKLIRGGRSQRFSRKAIKKDPSLDPRIQPGDVIEVEGDL
jgi:polysaccharide export outer membrane protein